MRMHTETAEPYSRPVKRDFWKWNEPWASTFKRSPRRYKKAVGQRTTDLDTLQRPSSSQNSGILIPERDALTLPVVSCKLLSFLEHTIFHTSTITTNVYSQRVYTLPQHFLFYKNTFSTLSFFLRTNSMRKSGWLLLLLLTFYGWRYWGFRGDTHRHPASNRRCIWSNHAHVLVRNGSV